jgi:hypothetical protein
LRKAGFLEKGTLRYPYLRLICVGLVVLVACSSGQSISLDLPESAWITYINEAYGYELHYPQDVRIEEMNKDASIVRIHTDVGDPFQIVATFQYSPGDVIYYLDSLSVGEHEIGGQIWSEYILPEGYCDGTGCSPPIYALQMEAAGVLYSVTFYSQSAMSTLQQQILSTFRIPK